jgi:DNA-directed DNA polymerase III PolC
MKRQRQLTHLDADAFFASVEQASDARLRGRPVAVGGERRGIVASASYEARRFGIFTPMPTVRARKLCPHLIVVPGDYEKYEQFSRWMFSYAYDFTPEVEITSIDEGYFDLTAARCDPVEIARRIGNAIRQSLKITVSEGIGSNKLVSQIASKLHKPAAFVQVPAGGEIDFLHPLPNRWLPGVGPRTSMQLDAAGLVRIGQVAETPLDRLEWVVGSAAPGLRRFALGMDERPIVPVNEPAKSYGQQETFEKDQTDEEFLEATLRRMADTLMTKVRAEGGSIRTVTVKVRYNDMSEDQCGESLVEPTDLETDLYGRLHVLLRRAWKRRVSLRLVSLRLSHVYRTLPQSELALDRSAERQEGRRRLARVIDELREERGRYVILRGHDFVLREGTGRRVAAPSPGARVAGRDAGMERSRVVRIMAPAASVPVIPLVVRSYYSFLNSTLSPGSIVALACERGLPFVSLCDQGNLHGAVEFVQAAKAAGIRPVLGAEVRMEGRPLWLYVESREGYSNLCRILSHPEREEGAGAGAQALAILEGTEGLVAVSSDARWAERFPGRFYLAASTPEEGRRLAGSERLPVVAVRPVHYGRESDRWKFDVVQSIRTLTLLSQGHPDKLGSVAGSFRAAGEWGTVFRGCSEWLDRAREIGERCGDFCFPFGPPQFPAFRSSDGSGARDFLRRLVFEGARERYPAERMGSVRGQLLTELEMIHEVGYEEYFLVVWDVLQECRRRGIGWITRGSAADSLVCYCLGISGVCPVRFDLYFRRFLNRERMALHKLPDIDVDFPHDRKDDVVDLVFQKYGAAHCAVVGGFSTFQARSAFAEVAKVLGVAEREVRRFTEHFPWSFGMVDPAFVPPERAGGNSESGSLVEVLRARPECADLPLDEEPYRGALRMAEFLDGFPRYAKMHPCGVVLSRQPLHELTPTFRSQKGYPTTHLDMDAVEAVGLVKIDILAQGGLAVMRDAQRLLVNQGIAVDLSRCEACPADAAGVREKAGGETGGNALLWQADACRPPLAGFAFDDESVWEMIASGGARAVHHIESPAMIGLCRMCGVREIDGLIAIVSVIRPGAANEQKKVRFTRRYQGLEPATYPDASLESCLRSTFGLVVYEEHILQICEAFAGLNPGRADRLRRALVKRDREMVRQIGREFLKAAQARGHDAAKIQEVWELVTGFDGYAFCKAHSTAYGVEAYQSAWLKRHFPAAFMAAVLTHGKGFYPPLVYVLECHRLGIPLRPPCINASGPDYTVEPCGGAGSTAAALAIRVPVTRVKGLTTRTMDRWLEERQRGPFRSLRDFQLRVAPMAEEMESLIRVGAMDSFHAARTAQFWEYRRFQRALEHGVESGQGWLFGPGAGGGGQDAGSRIPEEIGSLPGATEPSRRQRLQWEMDLLGFAVSGHPLEFHGDVAWETYCPIARLGEHLGEEIVTCGLVIEQRVHHQVTGEPMKFLTLCDRTGMVETELFAPTYRRYGLATVRYPVLEVTARVEPFENGRGHTLRVMRAGKPRLASHVRP